MSELAVIEISKDSFLRALELSDVESRLSGPDERDFLFRIVLETLASRGIETLDSTTNEPGFELPMRVPGTSFVVRLDRPTQNELALLVSVAFVVAGDGHVDPKTVAATALAGLLARVKKLNTAEGERSVFEAVRQASPPTAKTITLALHGRPCRHPSVQCRFMAGDALNCGIDLTGAEATLLALVEKNVLVRRNSVEPREYGVGL